MRRLKRVGMVVLIVSQMVLAGPEKPNIILVMADDQGWGDTGYNGHPIVKTPELDAMARDGDWKIIRVEGLPVVLYNLKDDIGEQTNLAGKFPERVERMEKMLMQWETELMDPLWLEGANWTKVRYEYHKAWFETGKPPVKKKKNK